jgi:heme exporter protein C
MIRFKLPIRYISLKHFYFGAGKILPWLIGTCTLLSLYGIISGLYLAPPDYQQGEAFRIIYVHVPAAFLSLGVYAVMGVSSIVFLIWRIKIADLIAKNSASLGATFTLIALITGALWGKPMWGTWWIWDARLTSELILLFLYAGYMGLRSAIADPNRAAKGGAMLAVLGLVDIPIIHFSVEWWATLHQGPTLSKLAKPSIAPEMLDPLISLIFAFGFFYLSVLCLRLRSHILRQEVRCSWVSDLVLKKGDPSGK